LSSGTQARADRRGLLSAALMGSGIGLALGVTYLSAGMGQAIADHGRAVRIARVAGGGFSETMLQREIDRLDPAALRLARAHDALADDGDRGAAGAWPSALDDRQAAGRHGSALEGARQLDCLTDAVYFEARGETPRGQAAVAQVVMNRLKSPSFPKTVCGVVFQGAAAHGCQFSFACDGSMRHGLEAEAWDRARRIAERTLSGAVLANIGNATHFHTLSVQPDWGPQMLRVAQVGLHVFYRLNPHAPAIRQPDEPRAVFVNLPMAPGGNLRLATAVVEKAADATVSAAGLVPADAKPQSAMPQSATPQLATPQSAKPAEPAAGFSKTIDPATASRPAAATAADAAAS
jgi:spore germination cell wall hydrolase CwlJ-like protein